MQPQRGSTSSDTFGNAIGKIELTIKDIMQNIIQRKNFKINNVGIRETQIELLQSSDEEQREDLSTVLHKEICVLRKQFDDLKLATWSLK